MSDLQSVIAEVLRHPDVARNDWRGNTWLTPDALDREHWRWTRWKRQHGDFETAFWAELQETWRLAL